MSRPVMRYYPVHPAFDRKPQEHKRSEIVMA